MPGLEIIGSTENEFWIEVKLDPDTFQLFAYGAVPEPNEKSAWLMQRSPDGGSTPMAFLPRGSGWKERGQRLLDSLNRSAP